MGGLGGLLPLLLCETEVEAELGVAVELGEKKEESPCSVPVFRLGVAR